MQSILASCTEKHAGARARAPTAFVAGIAAFVALGPTAVASPRGPDADCDGIVNASDRCPAQAEDLDRHADADGCPDPDNDGDAIADAADSCPNEAEIVNDFEDGDGCPDKAVEVTKDRIEVKQRIQFAFDKAEILARSYPILAEIAQAAREHPEIRVLRIEGHADDTGAVGYNQQLSERRATAVNDHLIGLGIVPTRLVHLGFGETRPVAGGTSVGARAMNRRVEFVVEFSLVSSEEDSVRDAAVARASAQPSWDFSQITADTDCVPMSVSASEQVTERPRPVADAPVSLAEPARLPWAMSLTAGGGVTGFVDGDMRDATGIAGSWEARLTLASRSPIAVEAAYLGSVQEIDSLGLDDSALLVSNGVGGAVRWNVFTARTQPYLLIGAAWRRYNVTNADFNQSSVNEQDDVLETPLGVGISYRFDRIILDARGVYRPVFENDLIQVAVGGDEVRLDNWTANLMAGFEF